MMRAFRSQGVWRVFRQPIVLCLLWWAGAGGCAAQESLPNTPANRLYQAAWAHDAVALKALLAKGISPNTPNTKKMPPLVAVISNGPYDDQQLELLHLLLKQGADPNGTDGLGRTALMSIAWQQDEDLQDHILHAMTILLEAKADIDREDSLHGTALTEAMGMRRPRLVRFLLTKGADVARNGGYLKYTPLHYVAFANDTERVKSLLKAGADVNARAVSEETPLALAAVGGSLTTLQALLDAGAEVNVPNSDDALDVALEGVHVDAALLLLQHGAKVNVHTRHDETPLQLAFYLERRLPWQEKSAGSSDRIDQVIQAILDAGADVNAAYHGEETALMLAIESEKTAIAREKDLKSTPAKRTDWVRKLMEKGANVNARSSYGTPLSIALRDADESQLPVAALLVEGGADVNAEWGEEVNRHTLLVEAMLTQHFATAEFLLAHGAKADCFDGAHKTPLLWAAFYGNLDLVKRLLAKGANPQTIDVLGQSALTLARKGKHPEVVAFLLQQGLKDAPPDAPPTRNARGQIVLHLPLLWDHGIVPPEKLRYVSDGAESAPALSLWQGAKPVTRPLPFTALLENTDLWSKEEQNEIRYSVRVGYYALNAYQFFGLITTHNQTYLGIRWYAPGPSQQWLFAARVFRLRVEGSTLELTLVRKTDGGEELRRSSKLPFLSKSSAGDLLMTGTDGIFALGPSDTWHKVGLPPKQP